MTNNKIILTGVSVVVLFAIGYMAVGIWSTPETVPVAGMQKRDGTGPAMQQKRAESVTEVPYTIDAGDYVDSGALIDTIAVSSALTAEESAGLVLMREEEKLARDVYLALGDLWGVRIFSNIAASEDTHMAAVGDLLVRYKLTDPIAVDKRGVFTNPELQQLYTDLVARGTVSAAAAFQVGALIEDLDINDLETLLAKTDKADITAVYENLQKGSRNHLRAFTRQIERGGDTYTPTYISTAVYKSIIAGEQERGRI